MSVFAATVIRLRRTYPTISPSFFHRPNSRSPVERPSPGSSGLLDSCDRRECAHMTGASRRFKSTAPSPRERREGNFRWGAVPLRGHLAHKVALADLYAEAAQDVVGRRCVKIEIRHRKVVEVGLGAELALLAAGGDRHLRILSPVELVGLQSLQEIDRLVDPRLHLRIAVVDGGQARDLD